MDYLKTVEVQHFDTNKLKQGNTIRLKIDYADKIIECVIYKISNIELELYSLETCQDYWGYNKATHKFNVTPQDLIDNEYTLINTCNHRDKSGELTIEYSSAYEMRSSSMYCTQCSECGNKDELTKGVNK